MGTFHRLLTILCLAVAASVSLGQSGVMKSSPGASPPEGAKSELAVEDSDAPTTPPTLRVVFALLLVAGVVAVVVVPSRKGGGDTR